MIDLLIKCTPNGGELVQKGNDLATVGGIENTMYLAMFGGNVWWGNFLVKDQQQFTSRTLVALREQPLNSAGRREIQKAAEADLAYLNDIPNTTWNVTVAIESGETGAGNPNKVVITVDVDGVAFEYMYNPLADLEPVVPVFPVCGVITGLTMEGVTCHMLWFSWTGPAEAMGYEYAVNTEITPPVSGTLITDTEVVVMGLDPEVAYRFWVRSKCAEGLYSDWTSYAQATMPVPGVTLTTGLVAMCFSEFGVTTTGTAGALSVDAIADMTANNNDFPHGATRPAYLLNEVNGYPVISFSGGATLQTAINFAGLSGLSAVTVFVVFSAAVQPGATAVIAYPNESVGSQGQWVVSCEPPGGGPDNRVVAIAHGNVGFDTGQMPYVADAMSVVAMRLDFTKVSGQELIGYMGGSPADWTVLGAVNNTGVLGNEVMQVGGLGDKKLLCWLVYARSLADAEILDVSVELGVKYGL